MLIHIPVYKLTQEVNLLPKSTIMVCLINLEDGQSYGICCSKTRKAEESQAQDITPEIHLPFHPKAHPRRVYQYKGVQAHEQKEWEKRAVPRTSGTVKQIEAVINRG